MPGWIPCMILNYKQGFNSLDPPGTFKIYNMAYDKDKLYKKALSLLEKESFYFFEDLIVNMEISKETFYRLFPIKSDENDHIKELIGKNKINKKLKLRKNWEDSTNATLQIGLYKLLGTEEERKILSTYYQDHTTKGNEIPAMTNIDLTKLPTDVLEKILNAADSKEETDSDN